MWAGGLDKVSTCSVEVIQLSLSKHLPTAPCSATTINLLTCRRANWWPHRSDLDGALGPAALQHPKTSVLKQATALGNVWVNWE